MLDSVDARFRLIIPSLLKVPHLWFIVGHLSSELYHHVVEGSDTGPLAPDGGDGPEQALQHHQSPGHQMGTFWVLRNCALLQSDGGNKKLVANILQSSQAMITAK